MIRFAFHGRVSTEDQQDPVSSKSWQLERSRQLIDPFGEIVEEFFDIGHSRSLPWKRRPEASRLLAALADSQRGFDAVVIGEPQRAFYGNQFGLTFPVFTHYGVQLWVPEVGGPIDPGSEAHDLVMTLFGGMSKSERMRIKTRVKSAMTAQAATQGRFLGGRPPYGYRLAAIGAHPHPEKAAMGVQLHQLAPDPSAAPVVQRIFAEYLAGKGYYAIAEGLTGDGIASPSGHDPARNQHRLGVAWSKSAVRAILLNPRYTGHQVWGKQRRDEILLDVHDVAAGHQTVMRWNDESTWTWSSDLVHEPLVSTAEFERVQAMVRSTKRSKPRSPRRGRHRSYALRGRLVCGLCKRSMQGHQANGHRYYRCRYPQEYARSAALDHPLNVYLREDDFLPQIDEWLADLFSPDRVDETIDLLFDGTDNDPDADLRSGLAAELRACDAKVARYRALLDEGTDPVLVASWLKEVTAQRRAAEARLAQLNSSAPSPVHDQEELRAALVELGGMVGVLEGSDEAERLRFYEAVGIAGTYDPSAHKVVFTSTPRGLKVRVGGGTASDRSREPDRVCPGPTSKPRTSWAEADHRMLVTSASLAHRHPRPRTIPDLAAHITGPRWCLTAGSPFSRGGPGYTVACWRCQYAAYARLAASSSSWVPLSTTWPSARNTIRSATIVSQRSGWLSIR